MISFSNINKQYGKQLVFVDALFQLNPGEKVGWVGPKGSGKTTLFRMVKGKSRFLRSRLLSPGRGGYEGPPVLDDAIASAGRVGDRHHELEDLHQAMNDPARAGEMDKILERFGEVQDYMA
jgi:ATPase subunit of ABC transporter with duplicated ATPase domains